MVECFRPTDLAEALEIRGRTAALPFAGGTDLMVRYRAKNGMGPTLPSPLLFLDAIKELQGLALSPEYLEIGASVPMALVAGDAHSPSPSDAIPHVLRRAAADLGALALRQRATLAGNVANASPAGDTLAALYALAAQVVLRSSGATRVLKVSDFIVSPGQTLLAPDEIITAIRLPQPLPCWSYWRKVGTRRANALTKVSVAAAASIRYSDTAAHQGIGRDRLISGFTLAFGAVGPTVIDAEEAASLIIGLQASKLTAMNEGELGALIADLAKRAAPRITPIDDQRSTAHYRKTVALNLIGDAILSLVSQLKGE